VRASRPHDSTAIDDVRPGRPHHKDYLDGTAHPEFVFSVIRDSIAANSSRR